MLRTVLSSVHDSKICGAVSVICKHMGSSSFTRSFVETVVDTLAVAESSTGRGLVRSSFRLTEDLQKLL